MAFLRLYGVRILTFTGRLTFTGADSLAIIYGVDFDKKNIHNGIIMFCSESE